MEFKVNGVKQDYAMKLGEGGEAFFVFETTDEIPASLQTSPLVSPAGSPTIPSDDIASSLQEPEYLDLDRSNGDALSEGAKTSPAIPMPRPARAATDLGMADLGRPFHDIFAHYIHRRIYSFVTLPSRIGLEPNPSRLVHPTGPGSYDVGERTVD